MKIIGIVGPSCSGKTTISELVAKQLIAQVIALDHMRIKDYPHIFVDGIRTSERPELYDGEKLAGIAQEWKNKKSVKLFEYHSKEYHPREVCGGEFLILEGFLLFQYPTLLSCCDLKFYIDLTWETIAARRLARNRSPARDAEFVRIGKSENRKYVEPQKFMQDVIVIDGLEPSRKIAEKIVQRVLNTK
jgi:uridine kinase